MAKGNTEKAPEKGQGAKVKETPIVEVVVTADTFGNYKKGDTIKMHKSTADACKKVVKIK